MRTTIALYLLCCDYHSGQTSRGYRLACKLKRRLIRHKAFNTRYLDNWKLSGSSRLTTAIYAQWAQHYCDKL